MSSLVENDKRVYSFQQKSSIYVTLAGAKTFSVYLSAQHVGVDYQQRESARNLHFGFFIIFASKFCCYFVLHYKCNGDQKRVLSFSLIHQRPAQSWAQEVKTLHITFLVKTRHKAGVSGIPSGDFSNSNTVANNIINNIRRQFFNTSANQLKFLAVYFDSKMWKRVGSLLIASNSNLIIN